MGDLLKISNRHLDAIVVPIYKYAINTNLIAKFYSLTRTRQGQAQVFGGWGRADPDEEGAFLGVFLA